MSRPTQSSANIYTVIVRDEFIYACASGCLNAVNRVLEYNPTTCFLAELDIAFKCALAGEHDNILLWMWSHNPNVGTHRPSDAAYQKYTTRRISEPNITRMNKLRKRQGLAPIRGYVPDQVVAVPEKIADKYKLHPKKRPANSCEITKGKLSLSSRGDFLGGGVVIRISLPTYA